MTTRTRRPAGIALAVALAVGVALVGCSGAPTPATSSTTTSPSPTPTVTVKGADAGLSALVRRVYAGRTGVEASAHLGRWGATPVAVVTAGDDATLAVKGAKGWSLTGGWWPSLKKGDSLGPGPRFVLVVGSDARPGQSLKGTRGDTLQLVGLDMKGGAGVVGIARDAWAPLPGGGQGKINAALAYGGGPGQVASVRQVSGVPVSSYVVTGFGGFVAIVDALGGVPVVVERRMKGEASGVDLKPGLQTLNGKQALAFARERKTLPDGDFGRSRHQGQLVIAAALKARAAGVGALPGYLSTVSKHSQTNLPAVDALRMSAAFYRLDPRKVGRAVAKGAPTMRGGQSVVVLDGEAKAAFARLRDGRL